MFSIKTTMVNNLLIVYLLATTVFIAQSLDSVFNDDVLGLIVFKAGLQDPNSKLSSWNQEDDDPCEWAGVECDRTTNRVSELTLDGFSLSGHLGRGLLRLQLLRVLSLANNNFTGSINPDLPKLGGLQVIDLSGNRFTGWIPDGFFEQCGSLRSVSFARNNITGPIPDSLTSCSGLGSIDFSSNQISGRLPEGIWGLRGLQSVDFSDNILEGEIPDGIGSLYDLRSINLGKNRFSGKVPADIGSCTRLKSINFAENSLSGILPDSMQSLESCSSLSLLLNSFSGIIPDWIGEMKTLQSLDLSMNNFSGEIPSSLGNLQFLKELNLSTNKLTGGLPDTMGNCYNLLSIDVSRNHLTGNVPSWMFKITSQNVLLSGNSFLEPSTVAFYQGIQVLDLSSNQISGQIPANIGALRSLVSLNMSRNQLFGYIPMSIGDLGNVQALDLSNNLLNGSIPSDIGRTASLTDLRLQKNLLSGQIPSQIQNCSSLTTLILSQNNLSGPVPAAISELSNLQYIDLSLNGFSGALRKELTNLSHLVYFNISHNHIQGELPLGGFFNTIPASSVYGNPSLCGSIVNRSCPSVHPKPIVLNPGSGGGSGGGSSSITHHRKKIVLSISALIAIGAAVMICIGVVAVTLLNIHARSGMPHPAAALAFSGEDDYSCSPTNDPNYGKLVMFSGDADFLAGAHALLNKDCEIGRGGFGVVYRTVLRDGRSIAIKKLTVSSLIKSQEDFEKEVKMFGKIKHQNLVVLEGYYWTPSLHLLIYEFVPNGSLYNHLHDTPSRSLLSWRQRFNIVLGIAKGLAYLHRIDITHYNLKSSNILIDASGEPKVGDFGLARLLPTLDRCILSSKIQSALGYMAPEFACRTVNITEKCDVYGFGILVLEVVTGKRPVEYMEDDVVVLCDMVRGALEDGKIEECVDGRLLGNFPPDEAIPVVKLGLICASQVPSSRPDMEEVINILELIQCPSESQDELERF